MPAGSAAPPRAFPRGGVRLPGFGGLPQGEVAGVALARLDGLVDLRVVLRGAHVGQALAGERPVVGLGVHVEVDVAASVAVGVPGVDEAAHEVDLVGDMSGGAGFVGGGLDAEGVVGARELAFEAVGPRPPVPAGLGGLGQDLVVDVGDVTHVRDLVAAAAQPADQGVEGDGGAQVADVRGSLHGGATQVDADLAGGDRVEGLDAGALGVVQVQHGAHPTRAGTGVAGRTYPAGGCDEAGVAPRFVGDRGSPAIPRARPCGAEAAPGLGAGSWAAPRVPVRGRGGDLPEAAARGLARVRRGLRDARAARSAP